MSDYDNGHDNYENDYNSAMKEVRRLRSVAREYNDFYQKVKEAFIKRDWAAVDEAIKWADE